MENTLIRRFVISEKLAEEMFPGEPDWRQAYAVLAHTEGRWIAVSERDPYGQAYIDLAGERHLIRPPEAMQMIRQAKHRLLKYITVKPGSGECLWHYKFADKSEHFMLVAEFTTEQEAAAYTPPVGALEIGAKQLTDHLLAWHGWPKAKKYNH